MPVKVLEVLDSLNLGGIQTLLMNLCAGLDPDKVSVSFLVFRQGRQVYADECDTHGWPIYQLPGRHDGLRAQQKALAAFFREHPDFDAVHYHTNCLSNINPLTAATKAGVPLRILHSHSSSVLGNPIHKVLHRLNKPKVKRIANCYIACGKEPAAWMYAGTGVEDQVILVPNGIDVAAFRYDEAVRRRVRRELNLDGQYVIGHVGRFNEVKNHTFLLDAFAEAAKREPDALLLLVGDGVLRGAAEEKAAALGLKERVRFLGVRKDVPELMQAMDRLALPSLYEGFPVTLVEAQAAGLPCTVSDRITPDAALKSNMTVLPLESGAAAWADALLQRGERLTDNAVLDAHGLTLSAMAAAVESIYTESSKR